MQTYDEILNSMTQKYTELSGITPDERSDIAIRLRVLAGEIYSNAVNAEWLKRQMFVSFAEGEYLDLHASERGLARREATNSFGEVTFSVTEAATESIIIPKGTVVAGFASLLRFETLSDAILYAGKTSVTVEAESMGTGREYNVLSGSISVMVTPPSGIDAVTNAKAFSGGCDRESDESLRERVINSLKSPVNSTNCAYYEAMAESVDGVSSASVVPRGRGVGTVDVYVAADGVEASDETVSNVQTLLSSAREVNVDVLVKKAESSPVNFYLKIEVQEGYDFDDVKGRCKTAISDYIASRGAGGDVLMCQVAERVYHTEGVKEFSFVSQLNSDHRGSSNVFPVAGTISIQRSTT